MGWISDAIEDALNGGIDQDFDGDIDEYDREITEEEELIEKEECERKERAMESVIEDDTPDGDEDYDGEIDEDEIDKDIDDDITVSEKKINKPLTISFAKEPRTVPENGFWKYYDESLDYWDLKLALIDNFPELRKNYDEESNCLARDIITEIYEYAPNDAIRYLKWLWDYFPAKEINAVSKRGTVSMRKDIIIELSNNYEGDKNLYTLFKEDADFINAYFIDSKWAKHDTWQIQAYIKMFEPFCDYESIIKFYELALKHHGDCFTHRDLTEFWDSFIVLNFMNKDATPFIRKYIKEELTRLLPESKKALKDYNKRVEKK